MVAMATVTVTVTVTTMHLAVTVMMLVWSVRCLAMVTGRGRVGASFHREAWPASLRACDSSTLIAARIRLCILSQTMRMDIMESEQIETMMTKIL
jgi:hypothetical protein